MIFLHTNFIKINKYHKNNKNIEYIFLKIKLSFYFIQKLFIIIAFYFKFNCSLKKYYNFFVKHLGDFLNYYDNKIKFIKEIILR